MSVQVPVLGGMLVGCCGSPRGDGLGVPLREHSLLAAAVVALPCAVGLRISCKVEIYTYEASQRIGGRLLPRQELAYVQGGLTGFRVAHWCRCSQLVKHEVPTCSPRNLAGRIVPYWFRMCMCT